MARRRGWTWTIYQTDGKWYAVHSPHIVGPFASRTLAVAALFARDIVRSCTLKVGHAARRGR